MTKADTTGSSTRPDRPMIGYRELLSRNVLFRRLWFGEVVSFLGDWFNTVALYVVVQQLSGDARAVATVFIVKTLPIFLMVPVAGPLIDRFDRRTLMIWTDIARAVCALGLIVAYRAQSLTALFAVMLIMVCFSGIFIPAKTAILRQITKEEELPVANALSGGTWSVMLALGAAAGGIVTAFVGIEVSLVLDSFSFLVAAVFIYRLPPLPPRKSESPIGVGEKPKTGFIDGLRHLRKRPFLGALLSLKACLALAAGSVMVLPMFGTRVFTAASGALFIGLLYSARGLGAMVGAMVVRMVFGDNPRTMRRLITPGFLVITIAYITLSQTPNIWVTALCYFVGAVGSGTVWVFSGTLAQMYSEQEYRGRLFSIEWGALTLVISGMSWLAGWAMDFLGITIRQVVLGSGLMLLLPAAGWLLVLAFLRERTPDEGEPCKADAHVGFEEGVAPPEPN